MAALTPRPSSCAGRARRWRAPARADRIAADDPAPVHGSGSRRDGDRLRIRPRWTGLRPAVRLLPLQRRPDPLRAAADRLDHAPQLTLEHGFDTRPLRVG